MIVHTYPLADWRDHVTDGAGCWCRPTIEDYEGGTHILHHSMDRREEYEEGRKPS